MLHTEINIVTCGQCGDMFAHELGVVATTCPYCGFDEDICHFPDLWYPPDRNDAIITLVQENL